MEKSSLNSSEIMEYLASRYPFLLLDQVDEIIPGKKAVGIKNVTLNEWYFAKRCLPEMIVPRSIQLESFEEVLALTVLTLPENKGKTPRFLEARTTFEQHVLPGDKMIMTAKVDSWKRGILKGTVTAKSHRGLIAQSKMMITLPDTLEAYLPKKN